MLVSDPIADLLTRIRNAVMAGHNMVAMPNSKMKTAIAKILKDEGYISGYEVVDGELPGHKVLRIRLKYVGERRDRHPVITGLERISRPGRRVYSGKRGHSLGFIRDGDLDPLDPQRCHDRTASAPARCWWRSSLQGLVRS